MRLHRTISLQRHQAGFDKFDFLVAVTVFGVLATALLARLEYVQGEAERTEVELTLRNMRVGIQLAVGDLIMAGKDDEIRALARRNPFRFLEKMPKGYEGEAAFPAHAGGWSYDTNRNELLYQPKSVNAFDGREMLRWRFESVTAGADRMAGLRITAVDELNK